MKLFIRTIGLMIAIAMLFSAVPPQAFPAIAGDTALACETAPTIIARTPLNCKITNGSVWDCMIIVECGGTDLNQPTATKDGSPIPWPTNGVFDASGVYTIAVTNKSGAGATLTFTIARSDMKLTVTDGQGNAVACGKTVATDVIVAYSGTDVNTPVLKKDNQCVDFPTDGRLTANGLYVITLTNKTGGVIVFYFTIKKTSDIIISAVTATGETLGNNCKAANDVTVKITGTELNTPTVTLNRKAIDWPEGGRFTANGSYHIAVTNNAGFKSEFNFGICREDSHPDGGVAPTIIARTPLNCKITNGSVWDCMIIVECGGTDLNQPTVTKDGTPIPWPTNGVFDASGVYTIAVTNKSGAGATLTFTIARSDMKLTVTDSQGNGVACGKTVATDVTVAYSGTDVNTPVLKKDNQCIDLPADGRLSANGLYVITLTNKTGGTIVFYFTIKKPSDIVISAVAATGETLGNDCKAANPVTVTITGTDLNAPTVTLNCNAIDWPEGGKFAANGTYRIAVTNKAGCKAEFTFSICREGIKIWAKTGDGECVENDDAVEDDVTVYYSGVDLDTPSVTLDENEIAWPQDGKFTQDGTYLVTITDASGDEEDFGFTISKPNVLITAKNPAGKEICDGKMVDCFVTVTCSGSGTLTMAATKNNADIEWPANGTFTENGEYVITLSNDAGASADFNFTISRCDGVVAAKSESKKTIFNGGYSNKNVKVTIGKGKTVTGVTLNGKTIRYPAKGMFKLPGKYVLTVQDNAATVTFTFTIDKSAPVILARAGRLVREGQKVRSNVTVTVTDANLQSVTVRKNNAEIALPDSKVLSESGKYTIVAVDAAGNRKTVHFTIKK